MQADSPSPERLPFRQSLPLAAILFVFWIILSGKIDWFHVGAGFFSAVAIAYMTCRLYSVSPPIGPYGRHPFFNMPWMRMALYFPWLARQIVVSSFRVAVLVLRPRMELAPRLFRFRHELPHNLARATLANSITLTPGTVTIDVRGDEFLVHALEGKSEDALRASEPGGMRFRVREFFRGDE